MNSPRIFTIEKKLVIGMRSEMLQNQIEAIPALWRQFMPRHHEVSNRKGSEFIALQDYDTLNNHKKPFDIWAAIEVTEVNSLPEHMMSFIIPPGLYAVFLHKGMNAGQTYQYIMNEWLPNSGYIIDNRPHFQVMGAKYKNGSPDSEEDFYVPIKKL